MEVISIGKLKVYLDTSVISHLFQEDVPEKMADTRQLWEMFRAGKYEVYLSTVTLEELKGCSEPKQSLLFDYLGQIDYYLVQINDNVAEIAQQIIEMGILTRKSYDDCQHIGAAIVSECDCIISQKMVQYNIAQILYLWEKFSLYTLTKSVKIPSISNKLGTDFTVVRVPQIDPSVALFPV